MPSTHSAVRRTALLAVLAAVLAGGLVAVPISAATSTVTGTLTYSDRVALTPQAVAIVTIVDTSASPDAGSIVGQQRIDSPTQVPIAFSVVVDPATLDQTHAYVLFATISDGAKVWQNPVGQPVITGGPTSGIALTLSPAPASMPATIKGTIVPPAGTVLSSQAVSIAALIKVETGTLVSRWVMPITDPATIAFTVPFDPALTDPAATYVVKGGIVDGGTVWQNRQGVPAIEGGAPVANVTLPVTTVPGTLPGYSPAPSGPPSGSPVASASAQPSASAAPSAIATPTVRPSAPPTASAAPTATPTPTPTPSSTPTPTPTPSSTPTPTPSSTPTPTPAPSPTPTPTPSAPPSPTASGSPSSSVAPAASPIAGPVTGTLTYKESYKLSGKAFAVVALVSGTARATESSIVASEIYRDLAEKPVPFTLTFDSSAIDPSATYTVQAMIVDGENSWATAHGVPVLTKGNPSDVDITLAYRPDLVKGTVTGQITALGLQPTASAYSVAVLIDRSSGESLGIDLTDASGGLPVAFGVPYAISDITPGSDYVVTAEVFNGTESWRNFEGVPVITNGNSRSGIQVVVTKFVLASPTPTPTTTPSPTPAASPPPAPAEDTGGGGLLGIIILITLIGAAAAFLIARGRGESDTAPPEVGPPPSEPPSPAE